MLDYIQYRESPDQTDMQMHFATVQDVKAPVRPAFAARSPNLLLHAVDNSIGFAQAPLFHVQNMIASGALAHVLPGYTCALNRYFGTGQWIGEQRTQPCRSSRALVCACAN